MHCFAVESHNKAGHDLHVGADEAATQSASSALSGQSGVPSQRSAATAHWPYEPVLVPSAATDPQRKKSLSVSPGPCSALLGYRLQGHAIAVCDERNSHVAMPAVVELATRTKPVAQATHSHVVLARLDVAVAQLVGS